MKENNRDNDKIMKLERVGIYNNKCYGGCGGYVSMCKREKWISTRE